MITISQHFLEIPRTHKANKKELAFNMEQALAHSLRGQQILAELDRLLAEARGVTLKAESYPYQRLCGALLYNKNKPDLLVTFEIESDGRSTKYHVVTERPDGSKTTLLKDPDYAKARKFFSLKTGLGLS